MPDSHDTSMDPLASIGLTAARASELNLLLQQVAAAEEAPFDAMDAMTAISCLPLDSSGDGARIYLMGGGILEYLSDLICICDEEWLNADDGVLESGVFDFGRLDPDERSALDLCSRALNTLGAIGTFKPFIQQIIEEDICDAPLEEEIVQILAKHINPPNSSSSSSGGRRSGSAAVTRGAIRFGARLQILHFPLLCAVLFWSANRRFPSCRSQGVFALSWLLTDQPITDLMIPAGLVDLLWRLIREQTEAVDEVAGGAFDQRVSVTQENLRLYACISLQRLSNSTNLIFQDQNEQIAQERLDLLIRMLNHTPSYNIRAILLHVLLTGITKRIPAAAGASAATSTSSHAAASATHPTDIKLPLPADTIDSLRHFRSACGSIGSSQSSRRTSPALDAIATGRTVPPMTIGSYASAASNSASRSTSARGTPVPFESARRDSTPCVDAAGVDGVGVGDDDDVVGELLRDSEQSIDKTAHLQQLVDAILKAAGVQRDEEEENEEGKRTE